MLKNNLPKLHGKLKINSVEFSAFNRCLKNIDIDYLPLKEITAYSFSFVSLLTFPPNSSGIRPHPTNQYNAQLKSIYSSVTYRRSAIREASRYPKSLINPG